jgi:tyrosine-protein phosphatase SIW14
MRFSTLLFAFRLTVVAGLIVGPVVYASHQQKQMRNFRVVREGMLYRSGQMTLDGVKRAIHDHGIRTVISLRFSQVPGKPAPDAAEEEYCTKLGLKYVRIPRSAWSGVAGLPAPVEKNIGRFLEVVDDSANYPILVHCFAGTHRTGAYCAIYRMEYEGWSNKKALEELKRQGYDNLEEENDIFGFLSNYVPRASR